MTSEFPKLSTGAVAQYPAERQTSFSNEWLRFVDGSEQAYRNFESGRKRWIVSLELLSEEELHAIQRFFEQAQGANGSFAFTDPEDGMSYGDCSFAQDELQAQFDDEARGTTKLVICQNKARA